VVALYFLAVKPLVAEEVPNAQEILRLVRMTESNQNRDLTGRLRTTGEEKVVFPFRMLMRGGTIIYQFSNPPESLILRLGEKGSKLERETGKGKTAVISGAKLDDPIQGTDITYEDLALKFIYWTNAKVVGIENIKTRNCWVVQAVPSGKDDSQYDAARLWVDKSGGLLKAVCYVNGKPLREFQVTNVQRAPEGGGYILKRMKIQRMDETGRDRSPTYLEID
jgi:hypothetical protein